MGGNYISAPASSTVILGDPEWFFYFGSDGTLKFRTLFYTRTHIEKFNAMILTIYDRLLPPLHISSPLVYHWCFGKFPQNAGEESSMNALHEKLFGEEIGKIAYNDVKVDVMCAFYFAVQQFGAFRNLVQECQKSLERQARNLAATPSGQDLTTGLLEEYNNAKLAKYHQAAADRLKIALNRVLKGDEHLPPWGPPLLPGDAPIEQVDAWIFPAPWMAIEGSTTGDRIMIAKATPGDPTIRPRVIWTEDAARAGLPSSRAPFWRFHRSVTTVATIACGRMARAGRTLAVGAASSSAARVSASQATNVSNSTAHMGEYVATATRGNAAQEPNEYIPPTITRSTGTPRAAVASTAIATAMSSSRPNVPPTRRALRSIFRSDDGAGAASSDTGRGYVPLAGGRLVRSTAPASPPRPPARHQEAGSPRSVAAARLKDQEELRIGNLPRPISSRSVATRYLTAAPTHSGAVPSLLRPKESEYCPPRL